MELDLQNRENCFVKRSLLMQRLHDKASHKSSKNAKLSILSISSNDIGLLKLLGSGGGRQKEGIEHTRTWARSTKNTVFFKKFFT